jgi:hypothetical protein
MIRRNAGLRVSIMLAQAIGRAGERRNSIRLRCRMDDRGNGKKDFAVFSDPITPGSTTRAVLALPFIANKSSAQLP